MASLIGLPAVAAHWPGGQVAGGLAGQDPGHRLGVVAVAALHVVAPQHQRVVEQRAGAVRASPSSSSPARRARPSTTCRRSPCGRRRPRPGCGRGRASCGRASWRRRPRCARGCRRTNAPKFTELPEQSPVCSVTTRVTPQRSAATDMSMYARRMSGYSLSVDRMAVSSMGIGAPPGAHLPPAPGVGVGEAVFASRVSSSRMPCRWPSITALSSRATRILKLVRLRPTKSSRLLRLASSRLASSPASGLPPPTGPRRTGAGEQIGVGLLRVHLGVDGLPGPAPEAAPRAGPAHAGLAIDLDLESQAGPAAAARAETRRRRSGPGSCRSAP